jgi:hypothetical protein
MHYHGKKMLYFNSLPHTGVKPKTQAFIAYYICIVEKFTVRVEKQYRHPNQTSCNFIAYARVLV